MDVGKWIKPADELGKLFHSEYGKWITMVVYTQWRSWVSLRVQVKYRYWHIRCKILFRFLIINDLPHQRPWIVNYFPSTAIKSHYWETKQHLPSVPDMQPPHTHTEQFSSSSPFHPSKLKYNHKEKNLSRFFPSIKIGHFYKPGVSEGWASATEIVPNVGQCCV